MTSGVHDGARPQSIAHVNQFPVVGDFLQLPTRRPHPSSIYSQTQCLRAGRVGIPIFNGPASASARVRTLGDGEVVEFLSVRHQSDGAEGEHTTWMRVLDGWVTADMMLIGGLVGVLESLGLQWRISPHTS